MRTLKEPSLEALERRMQKPKPVLCVLCGQYPDMCLCSERETYTSLLEIRVSKKHGLADDPTPGQLLQVLRYDAEGYYVVGLVGRLRPMPPGQQGHAPTDFVTEEGARRMLQKNGEPLSRDGLHAYCRRHGIKRYGYGPRYVYSISELFPPSTPPKPHGRW